MELTLLISYAISFFSLFVLYVFMLTFFKYRKQYHKSLPLSSSHTFVSIIIPAHNEEKHLENCLNSIFSLDYSKDKLEVIVVDDGSSDRTYEIAKSFESGCDPCRASVRVFKKENKGKASALNFGLSKANGKFIATMDADSWVTPCTIKELLSFFDDPEVMAATPAVKIKPSSSWLKEIQRIEYLMILFARRILSFMESVPVTPGPFSMFRSVVFKKIGGFDENNLVEDHEIALRIQANNYKIRSSVTAEVYTDPPANMHDLILQRVRWQRGGMHNYWNYRKLVKPKYGDFGIYFVPLNFATILAFFALLAITVSSFLSTPYYTKYILIDTFGLSIGTFTFIWFFVFIATTAFVYLSVKSFKTEHVRFRYIASFLFVYWYILLGYNLLWVFKELKREPYKW